MKYTLLLAISAIFVSAYGMEEIKPRDLIIRNEVGQKVKITYGLVDGKTVESVLANNEAVRYPLEDDVTTFIVRPYGEIRGKATPESLGMMPKDYAYKLKLALKKAADDQNISVVVKQGGLPQEGMLGIMGSALEAVVPNILVEKAKATLKEYAFPYDISVSLQKFEEDEPIIPESRKIIDVFPAARAILDNPLAEEKYFSIEPRYILGLAMHSPKENVEAIYKIHKNKWENFIKDPKTSDKDVAFAEEVLTILKDAYQSLMLKFKYEDRLIKSK